MEVGSLLNRAWTIVVSFHGIRSLTYANVFDPATGIHVVCLHPCFLSSSKNLDSLEAEHGKKGP